MHIRAVFCLISGVALSCASAFVQAAQVAPNPNPSGNTIWLTGTSVDTNSINFINSGDFIILDGWFTNTGTLTNNSGATSVGVANYSGSWFENFASGTINNNGSSARLTNLGMFNNYGGTMNNSGHWYNSYQWAGSSSIGAGVLNNYSGVLNNSGDFSNTGMLNNDAGATLNNSGTLTLGPGMSYTTLTSYTSTIMNAGTLNNSGSLTVYSYSLLSNSGTLNNSGNLHNRDRVSNAGTLSNQAGATLYNNEYASFTNYGSLNNAAGGLLTNDTRGVFRTYLAMTNSGIFKNAGSLANYGTLVNDGTIQTFADSYTPFSGTYSQYFGATINNGSIVQNTIEIYGGTLSGAGSITGAVTVGPDAVVAPGNSPGTLTINGSFTSSGRLVFEIGGTLAGQYDVLQINGAAAFAGGTIEFDFIDGFSVSAGDSWDFLFADSLTGWDTLAFTFDEFSAGLFWRFDHLSNGATRLVFAQNAIAGAVPEPESWAMLIAGLGLLGVIARRRRQRA